MTLGFSTKWPKHMPAHMAGQPTCFQEKVAECLLRNKSVKMAPYAWTNHLVNQDVEKYIIGSQKAKGHSIREDKHNRWKVGMDIHFVIKNRTPQRFQFAPVVKCTGIQDIVISYHDIYKQKVAQPVVWIEGVWLPNVQELAVNDGFNSVEDFFAWFNTDFTGKIIHWTDHRY